VLPIFILKLAHRDNDENNNCHRQEDINPHHAHIVSNRGIVRTLTLGANQHCPLMQCGSFPLIYPDDAAGFDWFPEISVAGRSAGAGWQQIERRGENEVNH